VSKFLVLYFDSAFDSAFSSLLSNSTTTSKVALQFYALCNEATSTALSKAVNVKDVLKIGTAVYIAPKEGKCAVRLGDLAIMGGSHQRPLLTVLKDQYGNSAL